MQETDFTGSQTAHINAVSMPTYYVTTVLVDGEPHLLGKNGVLSSVSVPDRPIKNADGSNFTIDQAVAEGSQVSDPVSDVSWRTPFGASIQHPQSAKNFVEALIEASPEVNTIRVDFNAATLNNDAALARFKALCQSAADNNLKIIVQYSDGEMAGRQTPDESLYPYHAADPSARMKEIGQEWTKVMGWFEQPENAEILASVYGWELINEPMAYKNTPAQGQDYARDIVDVLNGHGTDWHGKKILVGGLNASAQFANIDVETIRAAVGDDLVWSMHLYPDWGNPKNVTLSNDEFLRQMEGRIGNIVGDDILLTEMHLGRPDQDGNGVPDLLDLDTDRVGAPAFNAARAYEFFAQNGIGMTYWPPVARGSSFLLNAGNQKWDVLLPQLAFANNLWSQDETPEDHAAGEEVLAQRVSEKFLDPFAQAYGYGGEDTLIGMQGVTNLLYGGDGNDVLRGGDFRDYLFGNSGNDTLIGGAGDDVLIGGAGRNLLQGGDGDDWIEATGERDTVEGGAGNDTIIASNNARISTGEGQDRVALTGVGTGHVYISDMTRDDVIDFSAWSGDASKTGEILMTEVLVRDPSGYLRGVRMTSSTDEALSLIALWPDEKKSEIRLDGLGENVSTRWVDSGADLIFDPHHLAFVEVPAEPEPTDPDPADPAPPEEPAPVDPSPSEPEEDPDEEDPQDPETGSGGGCFVATAAYGHRMEPDVVALRRFRDHHLVNYRLGRAFIRAYWVVGPALAARVSPDSTQGRAVRAILSRAVKVLQRRGLTG